MLCEARENFAKFWTFHCNMNKNTWCLKNYIQTKSWNCCHWSFQSHCWVEIFLKNPEKYSVRGARTTLSSLTSSGLNFGTQDTNKLKQKKDLKRSFCFFFFFAMGQIQKDKQKMFSSPPQTKLSWQDENVLDYCRETCPLQFQLIQLMVSTLTELVKFPEAGFKT